MKVAIGTDHGGYDLKSTVIEQLNGLGHTVLDMGANDSRPTDYPDFARAVCEAMISGHAELGIVLCGSGLGAAVAANKFPGIRAAVCHDTYSAHQGREHDDVNVLCLGARVIGKSLAADIVKVWLEAQFDGMPSHSRRLEKVAAIEKQYFQPGEKFSSRS